MKTFKYILAASFVWLIRGVIGLGIVAMIWILWLFVQSVITMDVKPFLIVLGLCVVAGASSLLYDKSMDIYRSK